MHSICLLLCGGAAPFAAAHDAPGSGAGKLRFVHEEDLPLVSVQVGDAALVHEAVVLRFRVLAGARGKRLRHEVVDLGAAVQREGEQGFGRRVRVGRSASW